MARDWLPASRTDVGHALERLVALAGVVDEHESRTEHLGVAIDRVVDARHRGVVVLVGLGWQCPVERVEHDQLEPVFVDVIEVGAQRSDVTEVATQVGDENVVRDVGAHDSHARAITLGMRCADVVG